ncbi:MAG: hypothetical protein AAGC92_16455 [Pseudomonadota bacterium]
MAQVTRVQYASTVGSLIPDNSAGEISESDIRSVLTDLSDSAMWYDEAPVTVVAGLSGAIPAAGLRTALNVEDGAQVNAVASVAALTGAISAPALRAALNVEDAATADQTGAEIVSSINGELGGTSWQSGGGGGGLSDGDYGDVTIGGSGSAITINAGAVEPAMIADADFGALNFASGVATLDNGAISAIAQIDATIRSTGTLMVLTDGVPGSAFLCQINSNGKAVAAPTTTPASATSRAPLGTDRALSVDAAGTSYILSTHAQIAAYVQGEISAVQSDPTGVTGADAVTNIISLTQAEYDAIGTPDAATLYLITDAA